MKKQMKCLCGFAFGCAVALTLGGCHSTPPADVGTELREKGRAKVAWTETALVCLRESELEPDFSPEDSVPITREQVAKNEYAELSIPTYITKIGEDYFIVDCYHDQVIYHDNLEDPLEQWSVMTDQISRGHTIAGDGVVYLVDDTERNRVLVFEKRDGVFYHTQTFSDIGDRPHYIIYNEADAAFYVWSSQSGEMYFMRRRRGSRRVYLEKILKIEALDGVYIRSFTILGDDIYFVSGLRPDPYVLRVDRKSFETLEEYYVPDSVAGMVQLTRIDDYFYITVSTDVFGNQDSAKIIRTRDLSGMLENGYEDVSRYFDAEGVPYHITFFDGAYYMTQHQDRPEHSVWRFLAEDGEISFVETIY